jgi:hypothetical protein
MGKNEIRPMTVDDRAAFCELTAHRPGFDRAKAEARTALIWHIAFENPSADGTPTFFVATDGARILCHMGRMPTVFWVRGERRRAAFAHDLFAHPELQATGAGFFVTMKLYKTMETACESFCGLAWTNEINVKLQQTRKYHQMWVRRWARPLTLAGQLDKRQLPPGVRRLADVAGTLSLRGVEELQRRGLPRAERFDAAFDARFDGLAEAIGSRLGICPDKTAAYLTWRYRRWPNITTTTYVLEGESGELRGFVVLRDGRRGDKGGYILDLAYDPRDPEAGKSLVAASIAHFREVGVHGVWCTLTSPILKRLFASFLFVERPPDNPFFIMNVEKFEDPHLLRCLDAWNHQRGDSEGGEVD